MPACCTFFLAGRGEQFFHPNRIGNFKNTGLMGNQRAKALTLPGNPFPDRHGKSAFFGKGLRHRQTPLQPAAQQEFTHTFPHLKPVWQMICKVRHHWIKERCPPLKAVCHQQAIKLDQQIIWQPVRTVHCLCHRKARTFSTVFAAFGCRNTIAPAFNNFGAQNIDLIKRAF